MKPLKVFARALLLAAATSVASGQSYGSEPQRLMIGAAEFRPDHRYEPFFGEDGYMSLSVPFDSPTAPTVIYILAPVSLPEGATINELCLYAYDTHLQKEVVASLVVSKLVHSGENDDRKGLGGVSSDGQAGYRRYCVDMAEVVRGRIDVDGDGILDDAAYYVETIVPYSSSDLEFLSLGGVRITWSRPVSPAPSAQSFTDVPDSHPFYPFIEALAASGITAGCGDGSKYCPDAALTRGQMAVFLAKALGLQWVE